jgi:hypothetical protein
MRKVFLTLLLCGFVSLAMAANTPTHKSPAVQKLNTLLENNILKTPESPEKVHYEVRLKEVVLDMCIYEVSWYTLDDFGMIDQIGNYTTTLPCPGQGFPICLPAGPFLVCL